jgi:enamine deaminase RidA (YjgF/YER057c/UK114 family)
MTGRIDARLAQLGIELPQPPAPVAAYVPFVQTGNLVFISGQVSFLGDDQTTAGVVGADITPEKGQEAARNAALNSIAHLKNACGGDLDRVTRCISLRVYVASAPGFIGQPAVGNGASNIVGEIFGEAGKHSRAAVGVTALPLNCAVEVESVWEIA